MPSGIRRLGSLRYVPGLDGMRAVAVTLVMIFHYTAAYGPRLSPLGPQWDAWVRATKMGWMGVDIFFVLSGFLITRLVTQNHIDTGRAYRGFIGRRAWRLLPAYVACLGIAMLVASWLAPGTKTVQYQWLLWTFTVPFWAVFGKGGVLVDSTLNLSHFWTLSVEWHFYLLFPWLLRAVRSPVIAGVVLIVVGMVTRAAFNAAGDQGNATYVFTLSRVDAFGLGCLVASFRGPLAGHARALALAAGLALLLGVSIAVGVIPEYFKTLRWMQLWGYTAIASGAALILLAVVTAPPSDPLVRLLERPGMSAWGRMSYSAYLWHLVFFPMVIAQVDRIASDPRAQYAIASLASTAFTIAAALLSYRLLEIRFLSRRPRGAVAASAPTLAVDPSLTHPPPFDSVRSDPGQ